MRDIRIPLLLLTIYAICATINGDRDSMAVRSRRIPGRLEGNSDGFITSIFFDSIRYIWKMI